MSAEIASSSVLQRCPSCGKQNRLKPGRLETSARCGACGTMIPAIGVPLEVDAGLFDQIVRASEAPVLVDFWAEWCGPCKMAAPEVARAAESLAGRAIVLKVDTERNGALAARYGVRAIPNFVVFQGGQPVSQRAGLMPSHELASWVASFAHPTATAQKRAP
ncbi:MAG: thioredoxin [Deltaproteobacteria bacterium]|nr:thioredoxin [Deltaproteobacteria bacterium]